MARLNMHPGSKLYLVAVLLTGAACLNIGSSGADDHADTNAGTTTISPSGASTQPSAAGSALTATGGNTPSAGTGGQSVEPNLIHGGNGGGTPTISPNTPAVDGNQPSTYQVVSGLDRYTLVGRFDLASPNAIPFSFLSSKVGVRFTGTSLAINASSNGNDGFNVVIDGNGSYTPITVNALVPYLVPIATGLPSGTHTAWITKRTEFNQDGAGITTLYDVIIDANGQFLTPPTASSRRMETIGDSSFAGYGVMGLYNANIPNSVMCGYSPATQNADYAIPALVAQALGSEITNLSWSGKGVVQSEFDSSTDPNHLLPQVYNELIGGQPGLNYNFNVNMDAVLICAGGDDLIGNSGSGVITNPPLFISTYANWLLAMRSHYPNALLVAAMSPAAGGNDRITLTNVLTAAVTQAQNAQANGDPNIIFFDFFAGEPNGWTDYDNVANAGGYGYGCNWHTSVGGSEWLAARLTQTVKAHLGW